MFFIKFWFFTNYVQNESHLPNNNLMKSSSFKVTESKEVKLPKLQTDW